MDDVKPKNAAIQIFAANNGFIVRTPGGFRDDYGPIEQSHVFRTMKELLKFVERNFLHRDEVTLNDRV